MASSCSLLETSKPSFQQFLTNLQEYEECLKKIDDLLEDSNDKSEYGLYVKALILRIQGDIHESLELFKKCHLLDPSNVDYLKQFGRSL